MTTQRCRFPRADAAQARRPVLRVRQNRRAIEFARKLSLLPEELSTKVEPSRKFWRRGPCKVTCQRIVLGIDLVHAAKLVIHDREQDSVVIDQRSRCAVSDWYNRVNFEIARERRQSVDQPRVQLIRIEMRIRIAGNYCVRTLDRRERDAVIADRRQPHVAFANIEDGRSLGTRFAHLTTTTQSSCMAQLKNSAAVLRSAGDNRPMERCRRESALRARAAFVSLAFVGRRSWRDQFRWRQHLGKTWRRRSAQQRARDGAVGERIRRRFGLDGSVRLREVVSRQTRGTGKPLSRPRARR